MAGGALGRRAGALMGAAELRALGTLAGQAAAGVTARAEELHAAIARRAFAGVGDAARPVQALHDQIARGAYLAAGAVGTTAGRAAGEVAAARVDHDRPAGPRARAALTALNGWMGDRLEAEGSALAVRMAIRVDGAGVACTPEALRAAFPGATGRVAVFVHGLGEHEGSWHAPGTESYGRRLARELAFTPVELRVNTGLPVTENGDRLARLLDALHAAWPVAVEELVLVGHSMGGLIARRACHDGHEAGAPWAARVAHVVTLGSPHAGAPLALATERAAELLARAPEGAPVAALLEVRSAGIKDLSRGADTALLPHTRHAVVSGTVAEGLAGRLLGDGLVLEASACGGGAPEVLRLPGTHHLALLHHPAVAEQLVAWLGGRGC